MGCEASSLTDGEPGGTAPGPFQAGRGRVELERQHCCATT